MDKEYIKIPKDILDTIFKEESRDRRDFLSLNEIRLLIFLCDYTNTYSNIQLRRKDLIRKVYTHNGKRCINSPTLKKTLTKFNFNKVNSGEYTVKLNGEFKVSTSKNSKIKKAYSKLPIEVWEEIRFNKEYVLLKLLLYILYLNVNTYYENSISLSLKEISSLLDIKYSKGNKQYLKDNLNYCLSILFNLNMIGDYILDKDGILIFLNKKFTLNENKKNVTKPERIKKGTIKEDNLTLNKEFFLDEESDFNIDISLDLPEDNLDLPENNKEELTEYDPFLEWIENEKNSKKKDA